MKYKFCSLFFAVCCFGIGAADANWQYPGTYLGDGVWQDDGSRFTISLRGGAAMGRANMENDVGVLTSNWYYDANTDTLISESYLIEEICGGDPACAGGTGDFQYAGFTNLADLGLHKNFDSFAFAAGASLGWTMPHNPQWRLEAGWDRITESEYNSAPLFDGEVTFQGPGILNGATMPIESGGARSTIATDVLSIMAFYDFFKGYRKPMNEFIPYVGLGVGYADSETTLLLTDLFGDLSESVDLGNFGERDDFGVIQFYKSSRTNTNVAGLASVGFSYGFASNAFFDIGIRMMYIPNVKFVLDNSGNTARTADRTRDWFSANSLFYTNLMAGVRFEF